LREFDAANGMSLPPDQCSRAALLATFPELNECGTTSAGLFAALLAPIAVSAGPSPSIGDLRKQAIVAASEQKFSLLLNKVDQVKVPRGRSTGLSKDVGRIRDQLLSQARTSSGGGVFSAKADAPFGLQEGTMQLNVLPSTAGGSTGPLTLTGAPMIDCNTQACTTDFMMVRVPTTLGIVDGWVDARNVIPKPPIKSAALRFEEGAVEMSLDSRRELADLVNAAIANPASQIDVVAVLQRPSSVDAQILARARAASVVNSLLVRLHDPGRVVSRVVEANDIGALPPVTVDLLSRQSLSK
jgi:hypothetical protein